MWQDWTSGEEKLDLLLWEVIITVVTCYITYIYMTRDYISRCREQAQFTFKVDLGRFKSKKNKKRRKQNQGKKAQQS